jgi:TatD DNase family protein
VIDTHAHLDACDEPAEELLARARVAGVDRVVAVGSGIESCRAALAVAAANTGVACALGVHPHQAGGDEAGRLGELRSLLEQPEAAAVGEAGLDFYRDYAPRGAQLRVFEAQLTLAEELHLPVVVHTRAADEETASILAGFGGTVVMHCFSSPDLLETVLERRYYVSFAGNVTYPKATELREAAAAVPDDRILAETDSPYLAPQAVRGTRNEPANVVHTLAVLAELRGVDAAALGHQIDLNADAAFRLSQP